VNGTGEYEGDDLEAMSVLPAYYDWIIDYFNPYLHGHGIEFGAGIGTVSTRLREHLNRLVLVEPSANLLPRLQARFPSDDAVKILPGTLEDRIAEIRDASLDVAVLVNVLEHIEDDRAALAELRRVVRIDGHVLIFVPALRFLYSAFDRAIGHHRRYHKDELIARVEEAGLVVVRARYFDLLGILPWWLVNTLGGRTSLASGLSGLYSRVMVPLMRPIERLVPPPVGKNIILIARRVG
jgi:SAM-dependent methyltransferase